MDMKTSTPANFNVGMLLLKLKRHPFGEKIIKKHEKPIERQKREFVIFMLLLYKHKYAYD